MTQTGGFTKASLSALDSPRTLYFDLVRLGFIKDQFYTIKFLSSIFHHAYLHFILNTYQGNLVVV